MLIEQDTLLQWMTGLVVGIPVVGVALNKALRMFSADSVGRLSEDARGDVVQGLRAELLRLQKHNMELVIEFERAQARIVKIASENRRLQEELENLQATVASMIRRHGANTASGA